MEEEDTEIEMINIRLRALGKTENPKFLSGTDTVIPLESALKDKRKVYIPESNKLEDVNIYDGELSLSGNIITGPAVIEKVNTSIFVSESYNCQIDKYGSFIIYNKEVFPQGFEKVKVAKTLYM